MVKKNIKDFNDRSSQRRLIQQLRSEVEEIKLSEILEKFDKRQELYREKCHRNTGCYPPGYLEQVDFEQYGDLMKNMPFANAGHLPPEQIEHALPDPTPEQLEAEQELIEFMETQ